MVLKSVISLFNGDIKIVRGKEVLFYGDCKKVSEKLLKQKVKLIESTRYYCLYVEVE